MMSDKLFPIYTEVSNNPVTICKPIDSKVFNYPFFNDGAQILSNPKSSQQTCNLEELRDTDTNLLELKGFIFHTSHCGSTLLSKMLNVSSEIRIVSEPEAINGLLLSYLFYNLSEDIVSDKLKRIIDAFRQPIENEKYLIIKTTSWNVFLKNLFDKVYPHKEWVYIDRNTNDVVNSLMRSNGAMENWFSHPVDELRKHFVGRNYEFKSKEDYLKRLVNRHREMANIHQNKELLLLVYPDFISQFELLILPHFDLKFTDQEIIKFRETLHFNSKSMDREIYIKT